MDDKDWFDVARDLGAYEGTKYCFPFAANALGLVHDQSGFGNDQPTWSEVLRQTDKLLLPLGDPEALTTIALYLSAGGVIPEKSGLQRLDQKALLTVFSAYSAAARDKRISSSSLDYQNDDQVWAAFLSSNQSFVMTWANHALSGTGGHELANLPGFGVVPYTLAEGWLWCVTEANERDRIHSIALAEYLTAPDFLAIWAPLSGYLPVRPSSIQGYKEPSLPNTILEILDSAHVKPDKSQISKIGIEFKRAISELILEQNPPEESVQNIISRVEEMNSQ
jgi:ABC-type glycerol-3-phosphate transport system substrate-binding protein